MGYEMRRNLPSISHVPEPGVDSLKPCLHLHVLVEVNPSPLAHIWVASHVVLVTEGSLQTSLKHVFPS